MRARGFTLVELTVVLVIIGLLAGSLLAISTASMSNQRGEVTRAKLKAIDAALVSFVAINKRLPCPANGTLASDNALAGLEVFGTQDNPCVNQSGGVVPWKVLGFSASDIEDGWGTRITYRLDPYLARNGAMDMSFCDPAGTIGAAPTDLRTPPRNSCGTACTSSSVMAQCVTPIQFLTSKGVEIRDGVGGTILMDMGASPSTGAAFVLISHGENLAGGYSSSGLILPASNGVEGTNETQNRADTFPSPPYYVDAPMQYSTTNTRFDDYVLRPSLVSVIQRAHLGPRSH
jgi:prepilin-type N-terminal cleavage/methylation domain-containing protein